VDRSAPTSTPKMMRVISEQELCELRFGGHTAAGFVDLA
jgi:hypothetical protein